MKAVFFDIDGTLWDRHNVVPESTKTAIKLLNENGHMAFICSGRTRGFIYDPVLLGLGFDGIVSGCGTMFELNGVRRFLYELPVDLVEMTVDTVRRHGFRPILEGKDYLYMEASEYGRDIYGKKLLTELGPHLKSIDKCRGQWEISKLSCATEGCKTEACLEELKDHYDYIIHNETVMEMVPKGFSKGTGILKALEYIGVPPEDTVAIGDSVNDLEMFETAGFAVAMGNGTPPAKEAADYITTSIYEDGIFNALKYLELI